MIATRLFLLLPVLSGAATSHRVEPQVRPRIVHGLAETIEHLESSLELLATQLGELKERQSHENSNAISSNKKQSRMARSLEASVSSAASRRAARSMNSRQQEVAAIGDELERSAAPGACARDCLDGSPGLDGAPGLDGVPGVDGRNGRDGLDGKDGKDGKDGPSGPAGPTGPGGPAGEPGRRGRQGPSGRPGPPGQPGVCAYQAKYECSADGGPGGNSSSPRLLMAPTMVGGQQQQQQLLLQSEVAGASVPSDERQVSVNEGDNIQLSCEAFGSPRPIYVWRRSDKRLPIILDAQADLKVTSYSGGQLPLARVDRSQAGSYECLAINGVPPAATKRMSLDINYAPTVRLWPVRGAELTASTSTSNAAAPTQSVLIECLVESSPAALVYWMFENELIMSLGISAGASSSASPSVPQANSSSALAEPLDELAGESVENTAAEAAESMKLRSNGERKRFVITESTGQLLTGATYSILTLNITLLEPRDWGQYKCVAKNLIGQTVGSIRLGASKLQDGGEQPAGEQQPTLEQLDYTAGWPAQLLERNGSTARYVTFGNQHRRRTPAGAPGDPFKGVELISAPGQDAEDDKQATLPVAKSPEQQQQQRQSTDKPPVELDGRAALDGGESPSAPPPIDDDELESCAILSGPNSSAGLQAEWPRRRSDAASVLLLDQIGKPVYVANGLVSPRGPVSWWSMDSGAPDRKLAAAGANQSAHDQRLFMTSSSKADRLFSFQTLADLQRDLQAKVGSGERAAAQPQDSSESSGAKVRSIQLKYPISLPGAQLIHEGHFYYVTHRSNIFRAPPANASLVLGQQVAPANSLDELAVVVVDLRAAAAGDDNIRLLPIESSLFAAGPSGSSSWSSWWSSWKPSRDGERPKWQPLDLGPEYKLNRVELMADENGVWLLVPTLEFVTAAGAIAQANELDAGQPVDRDKSWSQAAAALRQSHHHEPSRRSHDRLAAATPTKRHSRRRPLRRLHALKLVLMSQLERRQQQQREPISQSTSEQQAAPMGNALSPIISSPASPENNANMLQREPAQLRSRRQLVAVDHHVSMKLDWRMIGQMFLIDGLLYGVKDKHAYSSKLQFAYDLYKCKLLSGDYRAEPHRTFTNHFGNTQLIKYNPNEPKRLFTIDSGNLLWRPVKLMVKSAAAALDEL